MKPRISTTSHLGKIGLSTGATRRRGAPFLMGSMTAFALVAGSTGAAAGTPGRNQQPP